MEILFLGTAAAEGIPALFCRCETCRNAAALGGKEIRTRCGYWVNGHALVDLTPDIMFHKIRYHLDLAAADTVCFTHSHTDHLDWADLAFRAVPAYAHIPGEKPLRVYASAYSCAVIRRGFNFEFGRPEHPSLEINEIAPGSVVESGELRITAFRAAHNPPEDCLLYLLEEGDSRFLQMNDTALPGEDFDRALTAALGGGKLNAVSMDCTYGREKGSRGHMGMEENRILKDRLIAAGLADEKTLFFANHFSHNGRSSHEELTKALGRYGISPAWDGMILKV